MRDQTMPDRTSFDKASTPDQTVNVTFTPPESWTFTPDDVKMTAAGKVILLRAGGQPWSWVSATVKDDAAGQFHPQAPNGAALDIQDEHTENGSWSYTVTVNLGGEQFTSPDPQITNKEP
jgi:hypothetical protein